MSKIMKRAIRYWRTDGLSLVSFIFNMWLYSSCKKIVGYGWLWICKILSDWKVWLILPKRSSATDWAEFLRKMSESAAKSIAKATGTAFATASGANKTSFLCGCGRWQSLWFHTKYEVLTACDKKLSS